MSKGKGEERYRKTMMIGPSLPTEETSMMTSSAGIEPSLQTEETSMMTLSAGIEPSLQTEETSMMTSSAGIEPSLPTEETAMMTTVSMGRGEEERSWKTPYPSELRTCWFQYLAASGESFQTRTCCSCCSH